MVRYPMWVMLGIVTVHRRQGQGLLSALAFRSPVRQSTI